MDYKQILTAIIAGYFFFFFLYLIGKAITKTFYTLVGRSGPEQTLPDGVFLLTGLLFFSTVFALIKTRGNTVMLLNVLLFLFFVVYYRIQKSPAVKPNNVTQSSFMPGKAFFIKYTGYYAVAAIFILVHFSRLEGSAWIAEPFRDSIFYIDISEGLKRAGLENTQLQYNLVENVQNWREPYHYFELWLTAGFSTISGVSTFYSFLIIPVTLFLTALFIIVYDLSIFVGVDKKSSVGLPLVVFIATVAVGSFPAGTVNTYAMSLIPAAKYQVYLLFFFLFCHTIMISKEIAYHYFLFLSIATFTSLPGVVGSVCGMGIISFFRHRSFLRLLKFLLPLAFVLALLYLYYAFTPPSLNKGGLLSFSSSMLLGSVKTRINIILASLLIAPLFFLPSLLIALVLCSLSRNFLFWKKNKSVPDILFFFIFGFLAALISWAMLFQLRESVQSFSNFAIPGVATCIMLVIIFSAVGINRVRLINRVAYGVLFFAMALFFIRRTFIQNISLIPGTKYSKTFLHDLDSLVKQFGGQKNLVAFIRPGEYYNDIFRADEKLTTACGGLKIYDPANAALSLSGNLAITSKWSDLDVPRVKMSLSGSPFLNYLDKTKTDYTDQKRVDLAAINFMRTNNIHFLITERNYRLSERLDSAFGTPILKDDYSGYNVYKLSQ